MGRSEASTADGSRRERLRQARLYLILGCRPQGRPAAEVVEPALAGGVDIVQLRDKSAPDDVVIRAARELRKVCDEQGALLIVNDRPELALESAADGVHVGQADMPVPDARRAVGGELLVGVSTHSAEEVRAAERSQADYLGVGPVHATPTKPGRPAVGHELVRFAAAAVRKPFFAIGGVDLGTAPAVLEAGAERLAVVRAIRDAPDPGAAAAALRALIRERDRVGAPG